MTHYTVHVPLNVADEVSRADRTVFVRDGFNVWAFIFAWLFLLWHRLWAAAAVWLALAAVVVGFGWALRVPPGAVMALLLLMHLFVGVEGNDLRRWRLDRRRFRLADVVAGSGRDEAEHAFFSRFVEPAEVRSAAALPSRVVARDTTPAVIGMFPDESGS